MVRKKVSIDFDGTLTKEEVQDYVINLMMEGYEIFIVTSRFSELNKHKYPKNPTNDDLWGLLKEIGISPRNVIFTNMQPKRQYLQDSDVLFHLDDDDVEIDDFRYSFCPIPIVDVKRNDWKEQCDKILNV